MPLKCSSWTATSSPTAQATPHSSCTSRTRAGRGDSPCSTPPPGRVQDPVWKPRSEIRVSSTSPRPGSATPDQRVGADPLLAEGLVVGQRLQHQRRHRHGAVDARRRPAARRPPTVEPSTSTTRGSGASGGDPAVVDDPQRVRVDPAAVAPHAWQVGGVDAGGLADVGVEAGLLVHLADHRVPRVLAVVEAAAGQGPELVVGDPLRQPAEQDLLLTIRAGAPAGSRRTPRPAGASEGCPRPQPSGPRSGATAERRQVQVRRRAVAGPVPGTGGRPSARPARPGRGPRR